jgi:hypothetical protein
MANRTVDANSSQPAIKVGDRVQFSERGSASFPRLADATGTVVGHARHSLSVRVLLDGSTTPKLLHISYLRAVTSAAETASDAVATESVERFLGMLQKSYVQRDVPKTLQRLLVEEEDKLARNRQQLERVERWIQEGSERIARLRVSAAALSSIDQSQRRELSALSTIEATQRLLEDYHHQLRDEIFPYCIMLQSTMVGSCVSFDEAQRRAQQFANVNPMRVVMIVDRSSGDSHLVSPER